MIRQMRLIGFLPGLFFLAGAFVPTLADDGYAALRHAALERPRGLVYNTDGCDILYWPTNMPVSVEAFKNRRLAYALDSRITTVSYCPQSAGFGHFTCRKAGEPLTNSVSAVHHGISSARNAAQDFFNIGTDALEMATDFCRSNNLEVFVSLRMNDQHDSSSSPERGYNALYPQFKKDHPECLVGAFGSSNMNLHPLCRDEHWSCVNFACSRVREEMKRFVRQFLENYDIDGVEFDFNRHCVLFKSVAEGGVASDAERAMMTELMRDLRRIAHEVGRRRGRYFVFAMRSPDSLDFNREVGIDLARWFEEGLVDIWIGSGYFRLTPWEESVALAHKYGVKFYASLDESRIERQCRKKGLAYIPGRETLPAYAAVMANARAAGVDGTYVFNREEEFLRQIARLDVSVSNAVDKLYFLRYRGSGGYRPDHWLYGGSRHDKLPQLDPGKANEPGFPVYAGGGCVRLSLTIDDDFDKVELRPTVTAKVLTNLKTNDELRLRIGNIEHRSAWSADGLFHFILTPGEFKRGENVFEVIFPKTGTGVKLLDFALEVRYPARHGKLLVSFDDRNFSGWEAALPLLARYDSRVTFFVNGPIDDRAVAFMRKAKAAGHSLGLHGFGHMSAPKAVEELGKSEYVRQELLPQIDAAHAAGFEIFNFACPYSDWNGTCEELWSRYFARVRSGHLHHRDPVKKPLLTCDEAFAPVEPFGTRRILPALGFGDCSVTTLDELTNVLSRVRDRNETLLLYAHNITDTPRPSDVSPRYLEGILAAAWRLGIAVVGYDEVAGRSTQIPHS